MHVLRFSHRLITAIHLTAWHGCLAVTVSVDLRIILSAYST